LRGRVGTRSCAREARNPPFDVGIIDAFDGRYLATRDPDIEIAAADRAIAHPAKRSEFAMADRVTDNAHRGGGKPCGLGERNQGIVVMFAVRVGSGLTRQAREGLGDVGQCLQGRGSHCRTLALKTGWPPPRAARDNAAAPAGVSASS
jgi:hypothetical protein